MFARAADGHQPGRRDISQERCVNHFRREAAARCPECSRFFCRECVTSHQGRAICASCLEKLAPGRASTQDETTRRGLRTIGSYLVRCVHVVVVVFVLWSFFYVLGRSLLVVPTALHEDVFFLADSVEGD